MDRNGSNLSVFLLRDWSLSARRAWIEIQLPTWFGMPRMSLSARRAWIEIPVTPSVMHTKGVALRKESVDRNHDDMLKYRDAERRSPQGERG